MPALPDDTQLQDYKFGDISRKIAIDVKLGAEGVKKGLESGAEGVKKGLESGAEGVKKGFESVVQSVTKNEVAGSRSCIAVIVSR